MMCEGKEFLPERRLKSFHDAKYKVFRSMGEDQMKYREIMKSNVC